MLGVAAARVEVTDDAQVWWTNAGLTEVPTRELSENTTSLYLSFNRITEIRAGTGSGDRAGVGIEGQGG